MTRKKEIIYQLVPLVEASIPLTSQGKFRLKKRNDIQEFGTGFAPSENIMTSDSYLEWQIGYDTVIGKGQKETRLNKEGFEFIGANGKRKYPYELSEIMFYMCRNNVFKDGDVKDLIARIVSIDDFFKDRFSIKAIKQAPSQHNQVKFLTSSTSLPTFITRIEGSEMLIEIMIQKQQYATGIQPMLYLIVPVTAFDNSQDVVNHTSVATPYGVVSFGDKNRNVIRALFTCFGMLSSDHKHDVIEILRIIQKNCF